MQRWTRWVEPQRVFLLAALIFGFALVVLTAPFQVPDEPAHFFRAYQISEGHFIPIHRDHHGGGELPNSVSEVAARFDHVHFHYDVKVSWAQMKEAMRVPLDPERRQFTEFVSSIYSPASYLPQAAAIAIGRPLGFGPLGLMYAGRIGNLLFWIALSYLALRITPACRRPLLLLLLMPMSLFQAASLSADPTTNGLAILFAAMVLRHVNINGKSATPPLARISGWECLIFVLLGAMLALSKFVYLPLLALVFLIPPSRLGGPKRHLIAIGILGVLSLGAFMTWAPQTRGLDTVLRDRPGLNPRGQMEFLRSHPSALWSLTTSTFTRDGVRILRSFVGRLGWLDTPISYLFVDGYILAMIAACALEGRRLVFPRLLLLVTILIPVALSVAAIALLNYVYTQPVGAKYAGGVQGRYLIPLAPAIIILFWGLLPTFPRVLSRDASSKINAGAAGLVIFSGFYTLVTVWLRYYGHVH